MRFSEFMKGMVTPNSTISSKRVCGLLCISVGIVISFVSMFLSEPPMKVDESMLILVAQFLTVGAGLLGLTLGEKSALMPSKSNNKTNDESLPIVG